jgi:N-acetylglucosaminyl-diphospho-decaprenol L-rhamnosyltransferase
VTQSSDDASRAAASGLGHVSVIVVTYENAATIDAALAPLRRSAHVDRVVVVDNGSRDDSAARAAKAGADEVVALDGNLGFASGVNRGLRTCDGEFVLLLNPDASIAPPDLDLLVDALHAQPDAAAAGPVLEGLDDGSATSGARRFSTVWNRLALELPWFWRHDRFTSRLPAGTVERAAGHTLSVDYVWGAALLVRREFLLSIGGLDERFFLYHEDEDLGRQARTHGRRVLLVTGARAQHIGEVSSGGDAVLAHARLLFATSQLLDKWSWAGSGRVFAAGARSGLVLQAAAAALAREPARGAERLRCASLLRTFRRRGGAAPDTCLTGP